jgi:threonine/homoserine/homoserine lactone efflux protein
MLPAVDIASLLVFAAAYLMATGSPGPGVAALVARVLAKGPRGVPAFIAGFVAGDLVWFSIAASGLALLAQTFALLFVALKWLGVAYLLWLAWKLWSAPAAPVDPGAATTPDSPWRLFMAGLLLTLGNPKVILFFVALLPTVIDVGRIDALAFAQLAVLIAITLASVLAAYALAAARARRLLTSPRAVRAVNRGAGVAVAGAAVAIATR